MMHSVQPNPNGPRTTSPVPDDASDKHLEPWERTARSGCTVFWCIVTIMGVIGGVACLAVGGANLGETFAERHRLTEEYNNQVNANYHTYRDFVGANITVQQQPDTGVAPKAAELHTTPINVVGSTRGVGGSLTSTIYSTSVHPWYANETTTNVVINNISSHRTIQYTKASSAPIHCSVQACAKNCNERWDRECNTASLTRACKTIYNEDATYTGDVTCERSELCGTCHYTAYIESVCMVMNTPSSMPYLARPSDDAAGRLLTLDHSMPSCYYPFAADNHIYTPVKPTKGFTSVTFQFRGNTDPFIIMQRVTKGTMHFGGLPEEEYTGPMVLMIIGLGLIICFSCGMCCYMCCCGGWCRRRQYRRRVAPAPMQQEMQTGTTFVNMPPPPAQVHVAGRPQNPEYQPREEQPLPPPVQMHRVQVEPRPQPQPVTGVPYAANPIDYDYNRSANDVDEPPRKNQAF